MVAKTAVELQTLWNLRDNRYSMRKVRGMDIKMTESEIESIKAYRRAEADALPIKERVKALTVLANW